MTQNKTIDTPRVLIIGGSDVNARIPIIQSLADEFTISVLGSNPGLADAFNQAGINYSSYNLNRGINPLADISTMRYLAGVISQVKPDIVHTFDTKPAVWGRLAAWFAHVPVVIGTIPGLGALYSQDDVRTKFVRSIYKPLQKLACYLSDMTIFQNGDDLEQFVQDRIVFREKTDIVLGSGVETRIFDPGRFTSEERHRVRDSLNLDEAKVIVTMVSRLIRSKGVLEFARVAELICRQYPQAVFLLIGPDDSESVDNLTMVERDLIINTVTLLGARSDIPELLAISDIFVLPTYYREGIPRVLLEAASMELPIIATQAPGCIEVVKDNLNGFLVPVRDDIALEKAVEKLITNPSLRKQFGQESRHLAINQFDISIVAEQTASIYKNCGSGLQMSDNQPKKPIFITST